MVKVTDLSFAINHSVKLKFLIIRELGFVKKLSKLLLYRVQGLLSQVCVELTVAVSLSCHSDLLNGKRLFVKNEM